MTGLNPSRMEVLKGRKCLGSGDPPGLQNRRSSLTGDGVFDSHALPPCFARCAEWMAKSCAACDLSAFPDGCEIFADHYPPKCHNGIDPKNSSTRGGAWRVFGKGSRADKDAIFAARRELQI